MSATSQMRTTVDGPVTVISGGTAGATAEFVDPVLLPGLGVQVVYRRRGVTEIPWAKVSPYVCT